MSKTLRRYTNVLSLLDILQHKRLTLLSPATWFDQNDALGLQTYSKLRGQGSVLALCFAEGVEQAHHWQIFSGDSHGVAIQFDKNKLLHFVDTDPWCEIIHGPVEYRNLSEVSKLGQIELRLLPFLKRNTFEAEEEYRIVGWSEGTTVLQSHPIAIDLDCIERVILGPKMPDPLADSLRQIADGIEGCSKIRFTKSRLVNNSKWAELIERGVRHLSSRAS